MSDSAKQIPSVTRRPKRKANNPVLPVPHEKRRKPPSVLNIRYMLQDHEIEQDIRDIQAHIASKPYTSSTAAITVKTHDTVNSSSIIKPGVCKNNYMI